MQIFGGMLSFITSEDVCWNVRNVKFKSLFSPEMHLIYIYIYHHVYHCSLRFVFSYVLKTKTQLHQTRLLKIIKNFRRLKVF